MPHRETPPRAFIRMPTRLWNERAFSVVMYGKALACRSLKAPHVTLVHLYERGTDVIMVWQAVGNSTKPPKRSMNPLSRLWEWFLTALFAPIIRRLDAMSDQEQALNEAINEVRTAIAGLKVRVDGVVRKLQDKPTNHVDLSDEINALKALSDDIGSFTPDTTGDTTTTEPVEEPTTPADDEPTAPAENDEPTF